MRRRRRPAVHLVHQSALVPVHHVVRQFRQDLRHDGLHAEGPHQQALSLFLVDKDTPGITLRKLDTLGRRSLGTYEVFFDDVRVPATMMVATAIHSFLAVPLPCPARRRASGEAVMRPSLTTGAAA